MQRKENTTKPEKIPSFLRPENYIYSGLWKCSPFATWFWDEWYSDMLSKNTKLYSDFAGRLSMHGGEFFMHKKVVRQIKRPFEKRIHPIDKKYFNNLVSQARTTFEAGVKFANSLEKNKQDVKEKFDDIIEHARTMMFFWFIGWLLSEIFDEMLKSEAKKAGIPEDSINDYIPQPHTPMLDQQQDLRSLKKLLEKRGVWELLKQDAGKAIKKIRRTPDLHRRFATHVKNYEWIQAANWIGEPIGLGQVLEQMTLLGSKTTHSKTKRATPTFSSYAYVASCISYLRQGGAEFSSVLMNKSFPVLSAIAGQARIPYRDMLSLLPTEIFDGDHIAKGLRKKIERRMNDNWCMWTDEKNMTHLIDDKATVDDLVRRFVPKPTSSKQTELIGQVANKGRATGVARVIFATYEFHNMQEGDVLVTTMTTPDFVILMQKASAIVTDMGGLLCHAAIVSRELGKPCVIGTKFATQILKDGDLVEVDANRGIVKILSRR